jgi:hypothetical protein
MISNGIPNTAPVFQQDEDSNILRQNNPEIPEKNDNVQPDKISDLLENSLQELTEDKERIENVELKNLEIDKFSKETEPESLTEYENKLVLISEVQQIASEDLNSPIIDLKSTVYDEIRTKLEGLKINPNEALSPPQIALQLKNAKTGDYGILGTLGNFSLIIGKAKSRKSFYINIALSAAISTDLIFDRFKGELPINRNEVLYFDTEQGKYHVQLAVKRICKQIEIEEPANLHTYHLRSQTPAERLALIEFAIYNSDKIGMVVIDGIKDLVTSINDESEATMIASKLLKWSEERNIHIIVVLHQNKSDTNARGHIGTELNNKAETVLSVTVSESNREVSIVEPQMCRNVPPEVFAFEVINDLPVPVENYVVRSETRKKRLEIQDIDDSTKVQLLTEVFTKGNEFSYSEMIIQVKLAVKSQLGQSIGDNKVKVMFTDCVKKGLLLQEKIKGPYTFGTLKESETDEIV